MSHLFARQEDFDQLFASAVANWMSFQIRRKESPRDSPCSFSMPLHGEISAPATSSRDPSVFSSSLELSLREITLNEMFVPLASSMSVSSDHSVNTTRSLSRSDDDWGSHANQRRTRTKRRVRLRSSSLSSSGESLSYSDSASGLSDSEDFDSSSNSGFRAKEPRSLHIVRNACIDTVYFFRVGVVVFATSNH